MEGLLKMNGQGDVRLLFRFKGESQAQYNKAIYNIRPASRNSGSTNYESGSNERQTNQLYLSDNTSDAVTEEEMERQDFTFHIVRMSLLLSCFTSCRQLLTLQPLHLDIFNPLLDSCDLAGVMLGLIMNMILGFRRSLTFSIIITLGATLGMMYIQDRDKEFHASSPDLIRQERAQFHLGMQIMVCAAQGATTMSMTQHLVASYSHKQIFDSATRIVAIGFSLFFATIWK